MSSLFYIEFDIIAGAFVRGRTARRPQRLSVSIVDSQRGQSSAVSAAHVGNKGFLTHRNKGFLTQSAGIRDSLHWQIRDSLHTGIRDSLHSPEIRDSLHWQIRDSLLCRHSANIVVAVVPLA